MNSPVPTDPNNVTERDTRAASIVLPEHEERLKDAHARNAHPRAIARLQAAYDEDRYAEVDAEDGEDDTADDGLDALKRDDLDDLADTNNVDLTGARSNAERVDRLRAAGVTAHIH